MPGNIVSNTGSARGASERQVIIGRQSIQVKILFKKNIIQGKYYPRKSIT